MKYILVLFLAGNPATATTVEFETMQACQTAKTVILADASYFAIKGYCFPTR